MTFVISILLSLPPLLHAKILDSPWTNRHRQTTMCFTRRLCVLVLEDTNSLQEESPSAYTVISRGSPILWWQPYFDCIHAVVFTRGSSKNKIAIGQVRGFIDVYIERPPGSENLQYGVLFVEHLEVLS